jgi:biopolymer transport protein TolR
MALVARRTGKRRRMMADINVVPYVDVMLVLVVILMVAAPFVNPSVVELPSVAKAGQQKDTPVRVVVRSDGRVSILEAGKGEAPVAAGQLIASVKSRQKSAATPVVIEADAKVQYKSVVDVMRDLQKAGIERVGLSVQLAQ